MSFKLPPRLYADLVGKPFVPDARGPEAYDCVGLVLELQRRQGRDIGPFDSTPEEFHRQFCREQGIFGPCREVPQAEPGCIVLLRMLNNEPHVGTMLDPWRMLHTCSQNKSASVESLLGTVWQRRVMGFYVPHTEAGVAA